MELFHVSSFEPLDLAIIIEDNNEEYDFIISKLEILNKKSRGEFYHIFEKNFRIIKDDIIDRFSKHLPKYFEYNRNFYFKCRDKNLWLAAIPEFCKNFSDNFNIFKENGYFHIFASKENRLTYSEIKSMKVTFILCNMIKKKIHIIEAKTVSIEDMNSISTIMNYDFVEKYIPCYCAGVNDYGYLCIVKGDPENIPWILVNETDLHPHIITYIERFFIGSFQPRLWKDAVLIN